MKFHQIYLCIVLSLMFGGCRLIFKPIKYKPILEVNTTDDLSWNRHFHLFEVDEFNVEIVESALHLFNNNSLLKYEIKGTLSDTNYYVQKVIQMDRLVNIDSSEYPIVEIELVPFIDHKPSNIPGKTKISFSNELVISSLDWGVNSIIFKCQSHCDTITLIQRK